MKNERVNNQQTTRLIDPPTSFVPLEFALLALPRSSPRIAPEAPDTSAARLACLGMGDQSMATWYDVLEVQSSRTAFV